MSHATPRFAPNFHLHNNAPSAQGSYAASPPQDPEAKERTGSTSLSESMRSLRNPTSYSSSLSDLTNADGSPRGSLASSVELSLPLQGSSNVTTNDSKFPNTRQGPYNAVVDRASSSASNVRPPIYPTSSSGDASRSPKDTLNAFISSGSSKTSPASSSPSIQQEINDSGRTRVVPRSPLPQSYLERVPRPHGMSPPSSPKVASISRAMQSTADGRNSSLDSAMSSSSNASFPVSHPSTASTHSHQSSIENTGQTNITSSEPAGLIAGTGNAEDVIRKLLKEKQTMGSRNEQLWKLVEKQRAMILGLHQDLERSLKDKERYRKKLKEHVAAAEGTSDGRPSMDTQESRHGKFESDESGPLLPTSRMAQSPEDGVSKPDNTPKAMHAHTRSPTSPDDEAISPIDAPLSSGLQLYEDSGSDTSYVRQRSGGTTPKAQKGNPLVSSPGGKTKKSVPAPLDLSQSQPTSAAPSQKYGSEASESEYDTREARPPSERGRRRTRAEDDTVREAVFLEEEEERRSVSKKSDMSKSKSTTDEQPIPPSIISEPKSNQNKSQSPPALIRGLGLESPRAPGLGALQSPLQPNMGSIGVALGSSLDTQPVMKNNESVSQHPEMPLSPGRPDRQITLPPRNTNLDGLPTGPLSPKTGLPLSPRAPKYPIAFSQNTPATATFPPATRSGGQNPPSPKAWSTSTMAERLQPGYQSDSTKDSLPRTNAPTNSTAIYKGFASDQYPNLLLPPNALPLIQVKVHSSRLRPSRQPQNSKHYEEEPVFTLAVHSRSEQKQLWRVEKSLQSLPNLDTALRQASNIKTRLPDRNLFSGHAPAKIDARRIALVQYFDALLDTHMDEKGALVVCRFFSTDAIAPHTEGTSTTPDADLDVRPPSLAKVQPRKEGYLAKKGKQFGGWKARYFVLENQQLKYFEGPGAQALGVVRLQAAQVGRQNAKVTDDEAEFRHAFLVLEPKRKDSSSLVSHVFCAESDQERDSWVEALLLHIGIQDKRESPTDEPSSARSDTPGTASPNGSAFQAMSYDDVTPAEAPKIGETIHQAGPPSPETIAHPAQLQYPAISGPMSGGVIQDSAAWGNKSSSPSRTEREARKRSMFGFISRNGEEASHHHSPKPNRGVSPRPPEHRVASRAVFGIPLQEAATFCPSIDVETRLPAPVYRCIEYLEVQGAAKEEGIFRLSGSSVVIKGLRDRFNKEGDVNLLEGPYTDVHAVASLLKLYLRELPESVLTRELHLDFVKVIDLENNAQKITAVNFLVHSMPEPNVELLRALSRLLIAVVGNSGVNKMTARNVAIVFAPTLNIPSPLINLFLTDHEAIFAAPADPVAASPVLEKLSNSEAPTFDEIRSPRKQMFSDLSSPSHDQTSFPQSARISPTNNNYQTQDMGSSAPRSHRPPPAPLSTRDANPKVARPIYQPPMSAPPVAATTDPAGFSSLNAALAPLPSHSSPSSPGLPVSRSRNDSPAMP
ncbi:MAG: hypothetical protein M1828_000140 [Chrysothrix sp. TS-e1954]|nr:MAG: hypothetical protein M1828_000140 [Chrysothrix sp. TS-e1954]